MRRSRLEFRILGPLALSVDGGSVPVGGPKQRALLALLLLSANRVVSRDRLIGELFAEQSVNSADHALRNQVSRLRKVLATATADEPRLVARPPGYLLRVEPGELDLENFEGLLAEGRELLAAGDAPAAAAALRAAEALWQGRPLADLEFEPFARIEVERLEELRLAAIEERIDAELVLGRQLALVPELEALSAEHSYRERFRAQLMLALYRCGRQAEGLDVYRRTRTVLNEELGLEPGVELQELERAILVQDPSLSASSRRVTLQTSAPERLVCPFKGLAPFEAADAEFFFGRERLVDELVARLASATLLAVVGPSGSGKSSLLRAGLLPALGARRQVVVRPGERPAAELERALGGALPEMLDHLAQGERLVVAVDQFEEIFAAAVVEEEREAFIDALVEAAWDAERRAVILIGLRADFFGRVAQYVELGDLVSPHHVLVGPLTTSELRRAIEGPAAQTGLEVEPELVDALVDDVAGAAAGLPLLSTALLDLWLERDGRRLTLASYQRTGGVRSAVGRHAEAAFQSLGEPDQQVAKRIVLRLVGGGDGEPLVRRRANTTELGADRGDIGRVLATLVEKRLLVAGNDTWELVHEALLEHWPRLSAWLEEDTEERRLHRNLTQAAAAWEAGARDPSELYRGARLAATIDWADSAAALEELSPLEREFLEESRTAFARETERQRRANRRLRVLLGVALVLLVTALAAGTVAFQERGSARDQAAVAESQRLGAQALVEPRLDRSLLLARHGADLNDSVATRSNLLAALLRSPAAIAVLRGGGGRVLDDALSPDGRMLAFRGDDGSVTFFDTRTLREVGPRFAATGQITYFGAIVRPVRALAFSPDNRTLAVGDSAGPTAEMFLVDARSHRVLKHLTSAANAVTADIAFSPDGRSFVTGEVVSGATSPPDEVLVARRATDGRELRRSAPIPAGRLIGFTNDGRSLLVTSDETTSYLLDARTLRRVRTLRRSGSAALSPLSDTAAFGQDDGSVILVELRTGAERPLAGRTTGGINALAFSRDGTVLATAARDGSVGVWDVQTASLRERFEGHAAAANGLLFSPDGTSLYSGSSDGSIIVWDVRGDRRLGRPFRFDPVAAAGNGPHTRARNASTAVAVSPDGSMFATSPAPGRVTLWRSRDQSILGELQGPCGPVVSLGFSRDGRLIAATGNAPMTVVWSVATRKIVRRLGPADPMGNPGVAFSPDGRLVATSGIDGMVRAYELRTGRKVWSEQLHGTLQDLDFSPDGKLLATAGLDGEIWVLNVRERAVERTIRDPDAILSIRFSPDGRTIATGDIPGNVDLWNAMSGKKVGSTLAGQNGLALSVSFNPSGEQVMTTSGDGKFRLWDLASEKLIGAPLPGSDSGGWGVFFPDGRQAIAVFNSGTGVIWNVDPTAWKQQACRVAHRDLTRAEWRSFLPDRRYREVCWKRG